DMKTRFLLSANASLGLAALAACLTLAAHAQDDDPKLRPDQRPGSAGARNTAPAESAPASAPPAPTTTRPAQSGAKPNGAATNPAARPVPAQPSTAQARPSAGTAGKPAATVRENP